MANNEETDLFRITNAKVIGLLAAALIFVVTYIFTGVINSPHSRINKLLEELEELGISDRLTIMEFTVDHIRDDDKQCQARQEAIAEELKWLRGTVTNYQAETKRWDAQQDRLINDCMMRTQ